MQKQLEKEQDMSWRARLLKVGQQNKVDDAQTRILLGANNHKNWARIVDVCAYMHVYVHMYA